MNTNIGYYFKHLTCTLIVVLGLMGFFAPVSQAATGTFAFSTSTSSVDEGAGKVNITINRVGGSTGAASVSFRTNQITAVAGSDFINIPLTTLNFAHKERQKVVSVNIINDTVVEPDETFEILLSNPTYGTTLGKISSSVITILDNDIAPVSSVTADTTAPIVSLTSPTNSTSYTTAQTVTIAAAASDNVGVSKVELYEGTTLKGTDTTSPYSFAWTISSANNGNHSFTAKAYDTAGNSKVSSATAVAVNIPVATAVYEAPVLKSVSVSNGNYQLAWSLPTTTYGDPVGGYDIFVDGVDDNLHHTTLSAVKSGLPLDIEHCFVVEARWTQAIPSVFPASNKVCVPGSTSTVSKPGTFEFSVGAYTVNENDGYVDVIINRVGGSDGQVSIDFRTGLISAVNGEDYVGIPLKSLVFANGETWKSERVSIINNTVQESEETFKVLLSNPTSGATLGALSESILTILDDDAATTTAPVISGSVKAFPGAEGFGAISKGGRGGKIVKVTNLNDSGAGSLREAVYSTSGPRIIVFEVAGVINLNSVIVIREPFVTIAGQTAPAPGITLGGYGLRIYTHDVVLQHIFVRPNPTITLGGGDGIAIKDSSPDFPYNIVIDHCSVSWANDENISVFPGYGNQTDQNVTISNSLVGEGHYGVLIGSNSTRVSFLRNAVMSTVERQPRLGGGTYAHVVNNLLYNDAGSQFSAVGSTWGADQVSYAGNTFIAGPSSRSGVPGMGAASMQAGSKIYAPTSGTYANIASNSLTSSGLSSFLVSTPPVSMVGITVTPVTDIEDTLMQTVGARPAERNTQYADEVDERFLYEIQTRTGKVINREIQPWTKPRATARDIDPLLPANPNGDDNGNGYTNMDEFLYQMALQVEGR